MQQEIEAMIKTMNEEETERLWDIMRNPKFWDAMEACEGDEIDPMVIKEIEENSDPSELMTKEELLERIGKESEN